MKSDINLVNVTVLIATIFAMVFLDWQNLKHRLLFAILLLMMATELIFIVCRHSHVSHGQYITFSVVVHAILWHMILAKVMQDRRLAQIPIVVFLMFAGSNFIFLEGSKVFNFDTFIVGSMIYISALLFKCFSLLRQEKLDFFLTNDFLLVGSPVPMFFGLSLIFAFKALAVSQYAILPGLTVYQFLISVVNLCYYALIIVFTFNESKLRHAG